MGRLGHEQREADTDRVHELALIESVIETVRARIGDRRVVRIRLRAGVLAAVVPETLKFAFQACVESTPYEGADLEVTVVPVRMQCRVCGLESETHSPLPVCPCGAVDVSIESGDELVIEHVEVH